MATYNVQRSTSSGIVLNTNDTMNVLAGGWANNTTVKTGATLNVSSGGTAWLAVLDGGRMIVSSGGSSWEADVNANALFIVSGKPKRVEYTRVNSLGSMIVSSNGQADYTIIKNGGRMVVSTYGSAFSTTVFSGGTMTVMKYAKGSGVSVAGQLTVSSGGSASNTQIYGNGRADVYGGAWFFNNTVNSGGMAYVHDGGWASDTRLSNNGKLIVLEKGSAHTNTISSGGKMYVSSGGSATSNTVLSGGTMVVSQGGSMGYGNMVFSGGSVVLYGSAGEIMAQKGGTVSLKSGATVTCLTNKGGEIILEKGSLIRSYKGDPLKLPDCDDGWNKYVYDKKEDKLNPKYLNIFSVEKIANSTTKIPLDKNGEVSVGGRINFVGFGDEADYAKFTLTHGASLSFLLDATGAAKFTIWSLTTGKNGAKTMKSLQATSAKKDKATGDYLATTKNLLLEKGDYYISVESPDAKKGGNAYYNVMLNKGDCRFFSSKGSDNGDDWDDMKTKGAAGKVVNFGEINSETVHLLGDWVGFGDAVDYRKFRLKTDADLSFRFQSYDAAKFTVYKLNSKTDKKGTTYSLKKLQSTKIKAGSDWQKSKLLSLTAGEYYFSMESTNAKKGGDATYYIDIEEFIARPKDADALTMPEPENSLLSMRDELSFGRDNGADMLAGAGFEPAEDSITGEYGGGLLAGL